MKPLGRVLAVIEKQPATLPEIAAITALSHPAVRGIIQELKYCGVIKPCGKTPSGKRGPPNVIYGLVSSGA